MARTLARLVIGLAVLLPAHPVMAADQQKQVLVLYSTRRDAQIAVVGDRELPQVFEDGVGQSLDFYSEYLDLARFSDPGYQVAFGKFLQTKYKGQRFDLVIAINDSAMEFIGRWRSELFRDMPVVFFATSGAVRRLPNSAGIIAELNFGETVAMAVEMQPETRHVFVVSGAESTDRAYEERARAQLARFAPRLTVTYLSGLPTRELEARLATLPEHSIVFLVIVSQDGAGENFHPLDYVDRVTAVANAPTYCWVDSAMNHGIVGGSLMDQTAEVQAVAEMGLRVLNGEPADSIPLFPLDPNVRQVDWRQLKRWGISEARVPAGTVIRFREPGLWEQYKVYMVGTGVLLLTQSALIAGLILQLAARRRAEARLLGSQVDLRVSQARVLDAAERERFRIARELHDDIGQRMAALTMGLDDLAAGFPLPATERRTQIEELSSRALQLAKDVQTISRNLHSSRLDYMSLASACTAFCQESSERRRVAVDFDARDVPEDMANEVALCVYRVLQEAVNNAMKHADARRIRVALRGGEEIRLEVVDDGFGFDPAAALEGPGLGLISMRERLHLVGGELSIESRPGAGATLRARVPLTGTSGHTAGAFA